MDHLSTSSGHTSETTTDREQSKLPPETKGSSEMTLMKLRRLTKIVMCKSERHRLENRRLQRSNIIKYLEDNVMHSSEQIRSLSLEMLCCTIPRLGNKTDRLLKSLLPKVFQCLKKGESKELKTRALHFLRGYFQHTRRLSGFIENFIKFGIQNSDPEIQISCCLGLNIIFDQDLGNGLYPQLVMPVANLLIQKNNFDLTRAAYRALKCIHKIVKDTRFYGFMNMTHPDSAEMYENMYNFENMDSLSDNNCNAVILEYQIKRHYLGINKDFGILDPTLLFQIQKTRGCGKARAVYNFFAALKQTSWTAEDLDMHILDLLTVTKTFVSDSNRLVQLYGFDVLKEIINKVGFRLTPHIQCVVEILQKGLKSANSKVTTKVHRVLYKLMRCIHPMTVVWNLLNTEDISVRESVVMLIQNILHHFAYHEIDMIALCNYLGNFLEGSNVTLANCSRDCIIFLLNTMRDCPAYGIKTEAIKSLLKNHNLSTQTLKDIGVIGNMEEDAYQIYFDSYSEEEISDQDASSIPDSSTVIATALSTRSLSTADGSNSRYDCACSGFVKPCKKFCKDPSCYYLKDSRLNSVEPSEISTAMSHRSISSTVEESYTRCDNMCRNSCLFQPRKIFYEQTSCSHMHNEYKSTKKESPEEGNTTFNPDSLKSNQATVIWGENFIDSLNKMQENISGESSVTSSLKERLLSPDSTSSQFSAQEKHAPGACRQPCSGFNSYNNPKYSHETKGTGDSNIQQIIVPEKAESDEIKRRHCTHFHMDADINNFGSDSEKQAGGDADAIQENKIVTSAQECDTELETEVELRSDVQGDIQRCVYKVDVINNIVYKVNTMTIDHEENDKDSNYTDDFDPLDDSSEIDKTNTINQSRETVLETDEDCSRYKTKNVQKSMIPKLKTPKLIRHTNISRIPEYSRDSPQCDTSSQKVVQSNVYEQDENDVEGVKDSLVGSSFLQETPVTEESPLDKVTQDVLPDSSNRETVDTQEIDFVEGLNDRCVSDAERKEFLSTDTFQKTDSPTTEASVLYSKDFNETPFMPKNRELPRTPVGNKPKRPSHVQPKLPKNCRKNPASSKRKTTIKKNRELNNAEISLITPSEEREKSLKVRTDETSTPNSSAKSCGTGKYNSPPSWGGCQWRRDLEYASKALPCTWVDKFENVVKSMKPFSSLEAAENEMKKAMDDLHGSSWMKKEEAMSTLVQLAKHHPEVVQENTTQIAFVLCNEVKNFRQSVAGKAILTIGHLYEIMGKHFENKLRLVVAALLAKSGNRTLAAYFRLIIKTLFKIMNSSPQKSAMAFIYEGYKHTNKAARETAAQFLAILTENLGPENSLTPALSGHMLKCAASFAFDSSALTRYCGKRMLKVFMNHPGFEKIKDHHLDIDTSHKLSKVLEQITSKGVGEDVLPITLID